MGSFGRASLLTGLILTLLHTSFSATTLVNAFDIADAVAANSIAALRLQPGGYHNSHFDFEIDVTPDSKNSAIGIETSFDRTLQYTLSTVEGKILTRGKVVRTAKLNVSRLAEGSYVMYFFRGHRVVKAVLLDRI